ncbi:hypothetical protein ABS71_17060 [bacterium SCN 62-11]|nr:hypothetical protein [Candidatus Eremiobacteraeota bacterium]ODT61036.1 MAG: hypothetical protein ABS71_17060 [bacterium SCN 62-11]
MKATHVLVLISSIALFAWTRPAPPLLEGPRGLLELRHNLLTVGYVQLGERQVDVRDRLGRPQEVEHLRDGSTVWTYKDGQNVTTVYLHRGLVVAVSGAGLGAAKVSGYSACTRSEVERLFGPPLEQTFDTYTYEAANRSVTFLFTGDTLFKTTMIQGD